MFYKLTRNKTDGRNSRCAKCCYNYDRKYNKENSDRKKQYRQDKRDILKARSDKWYQDNREYVLGKHKEWKANNKERRQAVDKIWKLNNPERVRASAKKSYIKEQSTKYGKLNNRMSSGMNQSLRKYSGVKNKGGCKWETLAGYSVDDLKLHLEKQFTDEMSWEAFMNGEIHIDHIHPISRFNYVSVMDEQFRLCWALDNLQPLWAIDNIKKGNKVSELGAIGNAVFNNYRKHFTNTGEVILN